MKLTKKDYIKNIKKAKYFITSVEKKRLEDQGYNSYTSNTLLELIKKETPIYKIKEVKEKSNHLIVINEKDEEVYHSFTAPNEYYLIDDILIHRANEFVMYHQL